MRLLSLRLEQYRNYGKLDVAFPTHDAHLFLGPNGSGKTNILEAISLLSLTKSFLGVDEEDVQQWGADFYRVDGKAINDSGEEIELSVISQFLPRKQKACLRNGVRVATVAMVGQLPVVIFLPQDLALFSGPPADRRRKLDQLLCQVSPEYVEALLEYQRVLKQRNALLRSQGNPDDLTVWDEQLAEHGSVLLAMRMELIETWNLTLGDEVRSLGEDWKDVRVSYESSVLGRDRATLQVELLSALRNARQRDVLLQSTTVGPHRDDWTVLADGRPLFAFASRGQQRVVVLALLFLEASYIELRRGERPVILLDDIFSELDAAHRARLLECFAGHQVFLTATDLPTDRAFPGTVRMVQDGALC